MTIFIKKIMLIYFKERYKEYKMITITQFYLKFAF